MTVEQPVLHLGLAGFGAREQQEALAIVEAAVHPAASWRVTGLTEADAWWVSGARTHVMPDGTLRVNPGTPTARSLHLDLIESDRPVAFVRPLPASPFEAACAFDLSRPQDALRVLERFTGWLRPMLAQFGLAQAIVEHQAVLGAGNFHVFRGTTLVAVVNMRGDVGVLPTASASDFEDTLWRRSSLAAMGIPDHFARLSLSQLMWHFATRTQQDLLPARYRKSPIHFRRPPRLAQRLLRDTHLLLLRELALGPATLEELQIRTGIGTPCLMRDLAALYMVGAITSNPKRAARAAAGGLDAADSLMSAPPGNARAAVYHGQPMPRAADMTAPAPLRPN